MDVDVDSKLRAEVHGAIAMAGCCLQDGCPAAAAEDFN